MGRFSGKPAFSHTRQAEEKCRIRVVPSIPQSRIIARLMRILLVKTSSLGDVIHNLPVVTDLRTHFPDAAIDWVVEEVFAEIPRLHPGVLRVHPVALRRWRKSLLAPAIWREIGAFRARLQGERYDLVIDTQGLLKSALITRMAKGKRCGYTAAAAREPLAARFYDARFDVAKELHAVQRNRQLAALAAGYAAAPAPDYGIAVSPAPTFAGPTAVLLTATSRDDKLWSEERWIEVGQVLNERGLTCLLPAGSTLERERAARIAQAIPGASVLSPMRLAELAAQLAAARIVIGVDTGLVHLAAALGQPVLALFSASDPALTGVLASTPAINLGQRGQPPSVGDVLAAALPLL
jgi:heptosyltransferase I